MTPSSLSSLQRLQRDLREAQARIVGLAEAERRRIGADLHDGVGQHLCGVATLAAALRNQLLEDGSPQAALAQELARLAAEAIELTRRTAHGLCAEQVAHGDLSPALAGLADDVRRLHRVNCDFLGDEPHHAVGPRTALHVYRIAQEAVHNAVRHGAADRIALRLETRRAPCRLRIEDNGQGFDPDQALRRGLGLGLPLMAQRAALIGGTMEYRVRPRGGMRLECTFARSGAVDES